ncbi:zinc finger protein 544-like isoform X11 [Cataglyphis hispanica]|uniref:zinc finger protein 544-like isoform X11 n=1 Tax=Cataglyphis hispanica TaxID=1086592 RepID=UPI00217FF845|nr:zinc finger protein 544-like isoform X11 [Cataglyphis hispanica]
MNSEQHALPATTQAQQEDVNAGQSGRPSYPGGLATATASLGNVGSTPHSSTDLRTVGSAVALASSVAKYWVLNFHGLLPGTLPQVSVYHPPHNSSHRSGGSGEASSSKESASSLNQEMALTSSSHHQQQSTAAHHHHQSSVNSSSHHSSLQSNPQIPVSLPGLNLDGAHIPASVSHLQAAHAQIQQQMQAQAQQQLHQQQQAQSSQQQQQQQQQQSHHQMSNHQNAQNNGPTGHSQNAQRDDNKVKDEGGSCTTERCSDNQVHCQVQCDLQLQPPQDLQQSLMQQQQQQQQQSQIGVNISGNSTTEGGSQNNSEKPEKEKELRQLNMTQFQVPDLKPGGHMMDVRTADGSVVKISAGNEQDLAKTLGVEMVQNMYKVNVEDINQLLAYHEVFGKLQSEIAAGTTLVGSTVPTQTVTTIQNGTPIVQQVPLNKFDIKSSDGEATPGPSASPVSVGSHACEICGKIFQFRYQLIVHRRYHTERKPFTCQVCGKAFSNANDLTRHGKCHLGGSMFTCTVCFHVFANAPSLERHMKRHATDKPYNCTVCGKSFARKEHLDNHTRCHTGETPYRCQYCSKTFTRKEHMVNHVRKHTGETPHRCDICKKSFTRKEHFMNHVMWHTGETPHHCQACGKKYTRKEHLANHMRSHTNDTPFRCEICGKSFTRKEHFTNHIMWHTGETPHRCDFCSKTFTRKEHLLNHVRQHTGESPHRCGFCSKSFTRKEHLVNHIRQHTELRDQLGIARFTSCITSHLGDAIEHESRHSFLHLLPVSHIWLTYAGYFISTGFTAFKSTIDNWQIWDRFFLKENKMITVLHNTVITKTSLKWNIALQQTLFEIEQRIKWILVLMIDLLELKHPVYVCDAFS